MLSGRGTELVALRDALAAGASTLLVGEAGAGKSTLIRAATQATGRRIFEGGGLSTLRWMEGLPLQRALGHPFGTGDAHTIAAEIQREVRKGVLVVDDLHWADPLTIDTVVRLVGDVCIVAAVRHGDPDAAAVADRLIDAGFRVLPVAPLEPADATELIHSLRPDLTDAAVAALVPRAGGNPLLLGELARTGEPSPSLRLMLEARLRLLDVPGREAFGLLALAGRPLPVDVLGSGGAKSLLDAGLAVRDLHAIAVQHAVLAEVAADSLEADVRRSLHARLARAVDDDGEAARHHASAGEPDLAYQRAMKAASTAERPGERASHLAVAATCASGPAADTLRLRAARALDEAHDWDAMVGVLDQIGSDDPVLQAEGQLLRARGAWAAGQAEQVRTALDAGLTLVDGTGSEIEIRLRIEQARIPIFIDCNLAEGVRVAREAFELAQLHSVDLARAEYFLGTALVVADAPGGAEHLAAAIDRSRDAGDANTEFLAANNLISFHESGGSPATARELAQQMTARAEQLGMGQWATALRANVANLDFHAGAFQAALETARSLLSHPLEQRSRDVMIEVAAMSLIDLGRIEEATRLVDQQTATASPDYRGREALDWVLAEAALWGGDPSRALEYVDRFLGPSRDDPNLAFGLVTRAWACVELGRDPGPAADRQERPMLFAVPHETAALRHLNAADNEAAAAEFTEAARAWSTYHRRGELRCAWAAAEAKRRAGDTAGAIAGLSAVEQTATELRAVTILARIHRSLRIAGERRSAVRAAGGGGLTEREHQVLDLVGLGLTNAAIARRLGIARRTVVALIGSASAKLGAQNRNQAASLIARD